MKKFIVCILLLLSTLTTGCSGGSQTPKDFLGLWSVGTSDGDWFILFKDNGRAEVGYIENGAQDMIQGDYTCTISEDTITMGNDEEGQEAFTATYELDVDESEDYKELLLTDVNWNGMTDSYLHFMYEGDYTLSDAMDAYTADNNTGSSSGSSSSGGAGDTSSGQYSVSELINSSTPHLWAYISGESSATYPFSMNIKKAKVTFFLSQNGNFSIFCNSGGKNSFEWGDPILSESAQSLLSSAVNSSSIGSLNMLEPANITIDGDGDTMSIKIDIDQGTLANLTGITRNGGGYGLDLDNAYLEGYLVCPDVLNSNNDYDFKAFGIIAPDDNTFILNFE